jgi:ribonuclease HI
MSKIVIHTDGGSRGNPGPAAIGIVFSDETGKVVYSHKEYIGIGTNNEAEYQALLRAFEILERSKWLKENNGNGGVIECRLDSKLVVEQVKGNFKVKQPKLLELKKEIIKLSKEWKLMIDFNHVSREQNKLADKLVNEALDELIGSRKKTL